VSNCREEDRYIAGPLNLDRTAKQADTIMGTQIKLEENDFEALDLLATNAGEYVSFDNLYEIAWGTSEDTANINHAKTSLHNLITQVNCLCRKFLHIEHHHDDNYKLTTHWGNTWRNKKKN